MKMKTRMMKIIIRAIIIFFSMAQKPLVGQVLTIIEASRSHPDTPPSVGVLWRSDQPDAETSTWQHTTIIRDRHPCPRRVSNPRSQQASGRTSTPETARPLESATTTTTTTTTTIIIIIIIIIIFQNKLHGRIFFINHVNTCVSSVIVNQTTSCGITNVNQFTSLQFTL